MSSPQPGDLLNANSGKAQKKEGISLETFLMSLSVTAAIFGIEVVLFLLLRNRVRHFYQPRTYLVPEKRRFSKPDAGFFQWLKLVFSTAPEEIIYKSGLDAYFFLRYLLMLLRVFSAVGLVILPVLLPINYRGGEGASGLDRFSWSNVAKGQQLWTHLVLAIFLVVTVSYALYKELSNYIHIRQKYLTSAGHRLKASATSVLISGIPKNILTVQELIALYDVYPGGVKNVWINRDYGDLVKKIKQRDELARKLEKAETILIVKANIQHKRKICKPSINHSRKEAGISSGDPNQIPENARRAGPGVDEVSYKLLNPAHSDFADKRNPIWKQYLQEKDRPAMRLSPWKWIPAFPLLARKVDTITFCRMEVARLNAEIEYDQKHPEKYPLMNSAFVQFNQQIAAHMACQAVSHHMPQHMCPRHLEVSPNDILWDNMKIEWRERILRNVLVALAAGMLIIAWGIPVTLVGMISQVKYLTDTFSWLAWAKGAPRFATGLISGVLPVLLLRLLMAAFRKVLTFFAKTRGCATGMSAEKSVQGMYFAYLFLHIFLVVSVSSGISTVVEQISRQPFRAATLLAANLPKASNFFFSYILIQAFSTGGSALLQIRRLVSSNLASTQDFTARERFSRATTLQEIKWGTTFPVHTNLACIGIIYSVISPLILVFNIVAFALFCAVYRHNVLYVFDFRFDTGGLLFPRAINQLFTGVYVMELCITGLFLLVRDSQMRYACLPQGVIMIAVTLLTIIYQITLNKAFGPLLTYLPVSLEDSAVIGDQILARKQHEQKRNCADLENGNKHGDCESPSSMASMDRTEDRTEVALFQNIADTIEALTPEERDMLVARAFQHPAVRAKRPAIWIPRDVLGVSDDEIRITRRYSKNIWISNQYAGLDEEGSVVYTHSPPDFDLRDLVEL